MHPVISGCFPSSKSYHDETTIIFRLEMDVPIFFLTTCYNKQEEPVQNLEKVICVSFYLKNVLFSVGKKKTVKKKVLAWQNPRDMCWSQAQTLPGPDNVRSTNGQFIRTIQSESILQFTAQGLPFAVAITHPIKNGGMQVGATLECSRFR